MKESYENMKLLVEEFRYEKYNWDISGSSEVIALPFDLQLGYTM
jgi:hypothetical protein